MPERERSDPHPLPLSRSTGEGSAAARGEGSVAAAYDAIAAEYDEALAGDAWMRRRLWAHFDRVFRPGQSVLDVGCGTGSDALYLAEHGVYVTAIDVSAGMVAQLRSKSHGGQRSGRIEVHALALADLAAGPAATFDGAISSFAGLSTEPDLEAAASLVARLLRPEARFIVHLLNRVSLWEWLGYALRGRWDRAGALCRTGERSFVIGNRPILHYPTSPDDAYRSFAPWFVQRDVYGLGILRPPHTVRRVPEAISSVLGAVESPLSQYAPFRHLGRFFVLDLERR